MSASIGKKPGYCGVALLSKEKPISVKYGLNNSTFDSEGRAITAEFPEFFVINVCKLINGSFKINSNYIFNSLQKLEYIYSSIYYVTQILI